MKNAIGFLLLLLLSLATAARSQSTFGSITGTVTSAVVTLQTGQFFTPRFDGFDPSNTNSLGGRPDRIAGASLIPPGGPSATQWFNVAAFKIPGCPDSNPICTNPVSPGRFGNAGVDTIPGLFHTSLNASLNRAFRFGDTRRQLQLRLSATNALNHVVITNIGTTVNSNMYGLPTGASF